ncbi:MAG: winged helix-turn-helix domain-containing protein, partial [Thermoleophilia bacterium]
MAVPSFDSLMLPVLETLADGEVHRPQEVSDRVAAQLGVSAEDEAEMLPSGAMPRYRNRILWALHYMKRAGVIASPGRGRYLIADSGRALLAEAPAKITAKTLERYPGYMEFVGRSHSKPQDPDLIDDEVATPEERLQVAYEEMRDHVAAEVLAHLRAVDPLRFERIVLEVLTAMGYGGSDPERASLTTHSHDG